MAISTTQPVATIQPYSRPALPSVSLPSAQQVTSTVKSALSGMDHFSGPRLGASAFGVKEALTTTSKVARVGARGVAQGASLARSFGFSALFAVPAAFITDFIDYKLGKIDAHERNVLIAADSVGYTASGMGGSALGAAIGTTFLGPGVGTVLGIGAGLGLGWAYEKFIRPRFAHPTAAPVAPPEPPVK